MRTLFLDPRRLDTDHFRWLLPLLRAWWKAARPRGWLFPGRDPAQPMTTRQLNRACHAAVQMAEINKRVSLSITRTSVALKRSMQSVQTKAGEIGAPLPTMRQLRFKWLAEEASFKGCQREPADRAAASLVKLAFRAFLCR